MVWHLSILNLELYNLMLILDQFLHNSFSQCNFSDQRLIEEREHEIYLLFIFFLNVESESENKNNDYMKNYEIERKL